MIRDSFKKLPKHLVIVSQFQKIGIISKPDDPLIASTVKNLHQYLADRSVQVFLDTVSAGLLNRSSSADKSEKISKHCDLVIVVGGDGTLLQAANNLIQKDIPLLGINLGRLGFLAEINPKEMNAQLDTILDGKYVEDSRLVLQASLVRNNKVVTTVNAVNDAVVHAMQMVRMIEIETRINQQHINTLRADGYIVATPTGSTAYSLSGGGPILHPKLNAIVLVPICPHTLSNRPIVVDADSEIEIHLPAQNKHTALASVDGQINMDFEPGDRLIIQKGKSPLRLIQPENHNYFDVLREKLRWSTNPK